MGIGCRFKEADDCFGNRLSFFDFIVFVFQDVPSFDEESVGIVIRPAGIAKPAFREQVPGDDTGGTGYFLGSLASEMKGVGLHIEVDAVNGDFLADIAGDNAGVVAVFFQVVIETFRRAICEVEGAGDMVCDDL